jgi:MFS family permease
MILFSLDVFLESESIDETKTGGIRGIYLTLANITLFIAPSIVGLILIDSQYHRVYGVSVLFLIPLFLLIRTYFKNYTDAPITHIKIRETISTYLTTPNLSNVFITHLALQLFYAFMIIYTPVYLSKYIGFSWSQIGVMFTIMLLPFALFELPIGRLADRKYGEREILTVGFIIMGLSTLLISFITVKSFLLWTILLFITRTGASFVEITSDSFFFKQVNTSQTDEIAIYRITRPLAFILAPLLATLLFQFLPYQYLFLLIGSISVFAIHWSLSLKKIEKLV